MYITDWVCYRFNIIISCTKTVVASYQLSGNNLTNILSPNGYIIMLTNSYIVKRILSRSD